MISVRFKIVDFALEKPFKHRQKGENVKKRFLQIDDPTLRFSIEEQKKSKNLIQKPFLIKFLCLHLQISQTLGEIDPHKTQLSIFFTEIQSPISNLKYLNFIFLSISAVP